MKIKTFSEMEIRVSADDLAQLLYRAKQGEIMFAENKANKEKIKRLKKEVGDLMAKVENQRKEVREMSVKWSKVAGAEARQPENAGGDAGHPKNGQPENKGKKPAGKEQQADDSKKPADCKKPSKGKKEAK